MSFIKKIFSLKSRPLEGGIFFDTIQQIIGFRPVNIQFYKRAFTHRSSNKTDIDGLAMNYERLEFLGDAMLSAIIASYLYKIVPTGDEGYLTKMRSKIVSRHHLNEVGKELKLVNFVESKVTSQNFGDNIHGNIFEALVGAIFLDKGFESCEKFIYKCVINPHVNIERLEGKVISYKSLIIEWCQKEKKQFSFEFFDDNGIDNQRFFGVKLSIENKVVAKSRATSKKKAEEIASKRAYFALQNRIEIK